MFIKPLVVLLVVRFDVSVFDGETLLFPFVVILVIDDE
jgi:hypothetical protein